MTLDLPRLINKTVFVSAPLIFENVECRAFTLLGVELTGLWLQSDELTKRLVPEHRRDLATLAPAVFVPFAHIAGVLVTTIAPTPAATDSAPQAKEHSSSEPKAKESLRK
jgi:hypothetical protein